MKPSIQSDKLEATYILCPKQSINSWKNAFYENQHSWVPAFLIESIESRVILCAALIVCDPINWTINSIDMTSSIDEKSKHKAAQSIDKWRY